LPVAGLYRSHRSQNIGLVASCLTGAYRAGRGEGEIELGSRRSLAVIAVDGLGFTVAAAGLAPDVLIPLTTTFPSTTTTALMSSLTGSSPSEHGVIGVYYLHPDDRRGYNCITGEVTEAIQEVAEGTEAIRAEAEGTGSAGGRDQLPRSGSGEGASPGGQSAFTAVRDLGVPVFSLPGELALLPAAWLDRALSGSEVLTGSRARAVSDPAAGDVRTIVETVIGDLEAALDRHQGSLVWAYLNLDDHLHRHGPDRDIERACQALDSLARRLSQQGVAVLVYADHGCAPSRPAAATMTAWAQAVSPHTCRLPAGGAGRVRWLYPHPGKAGWLADRLRLALPGTVVTSPAELSRWGLVEEGSIGQARLGEVVLLARGPDFPVPDPGLAYEHGSMTAEEILVPLAIWQAAR
jgi:hypothetical protein